MAVGMLQRDEDMEIPPIDLLSWTFGNPGYDQSKDIFVDTEDDRNRLSAVDAKRYIRKLIAGLRARGIGKGARVCLHSFSNIWYPILWFAIVGAGGCVVGSNPAYTAAEFRHLLEETKPQLVIAEPELLNNVREAIREVAVTDIRLLAFNTRTYDLTEGTASWKELLRHGEDEWGTFNDEHTAKETTAALMFTSGTTGTFKAAALSHYALVARCVSQFDTTERPYEVRRLLCLPMFQAMVLPWSMIEPLRRRQLTYVMKRFDAERFPKLVARYHITVTMFVPHIVFTLLGSPSFMPRFLASLRDIFVGGAPLSLASFRQMKAALSPGARLHLGFGCSEAGRITMLRFPDEDDTGSVGRLLPNIEVKLIDDNGNNAGEGPGQIVIRSSTLMSGYLDRLDSTIDKEGWYKTGDVAYTRDTKWYIVGRAKDLIKVRGWQVAPVEVENCIMTHPEVGDVAVVGVSAPGVEGEVPKAYVVRKVVSGKPSVSERDIQDHVERQLSKYKWLAGGVEFIGLIPRNSNGKIMRAKLRDGA